MQFLAGFVAKSTWEPILKAWLYLASEGDKVSVCVHLCEPSLLQFLRYTTFASKSARSASSDGPKALMTLMLTQQRGSGSIDSSAQI